MAGERGCGVGRGGEACGPHHGATEYRSFFEGKLIRGGTVLNQQQRPGVFLDEGSILALVVILQGEVEDGIVHKLAHEGLGLHGQLGGAQTGVYRSKVQGHNRRTAGGQG